MYKAIIFDLDDTLYDYESIHKSAMKKLRVFTCEKMRISEKEFDIAFLAAKKETKEFELNWENHNVINIDSTFSSIDNY